MRTRLFAVHIVFALFAATFGVSQASGLSNAAALPRVLDVIVLTQGGVPVVGADVSVGVDTEVTDVFGRVRFPAASPGTIRISHPAHPNRTVAWAGGGDRVTVVLAQRVRRAVHIAGTIPGTARWQELLTLADRTSLNAMMIDIKDESGRIFPSSASTWGAKAGAILSRWDLQTIVDEVHSHGLDVITRIVTFQDPVAGRALPDMAARYASSGRPYSKNGQYFLDPTDPNARAYAMELASEACAAGVDEVQFDYVRFPDGIARGVVFDGGSSASVRVSTITGFLADAKATLPDGCDVAADIFGFITSIDGDGGIGQQLSSLAGVVDVVSPMVYPNHWGNGWFGFAVPANHPGPVVDGSSRNALDRVAGTSTAVRPWLQDFGGYGSTQVRAQIDAADALGLGWMIWNAGSRFHEGGIPTDAEGVTPAGPPAPIVQTRPSSGFWDVADGTTFSDDIAWLGESGITHGCNPPWSDSFCPRRILSRGEVATLLVNALHLPPSSVDRFDDDNGSTHESSINALAAAGITRGCGPRAYCPYTQLTRAEMAALLARAFDLAPAPGNTFDDDDGMGLEPDIERIAAVGITRGCGPREFCPTDPVPREQVAAFLHRALSS